MKINNSSFLLFLGISISTLFFSLIILIFTTPIATLPYKAVISSTKGSTFDTNIDLLTPVFIDKTLEAGITHPHLQSSSVISGIHEALGAGACAFDYDDDGWIDLFIIGGSGERHHYGKGEWWHKQKGNRLYRNLGHISFEDVTDISGLTKLDDWGMGCMAADLDNDGDQDLLLMNYGKNRLYRNNGDATFSDITKSSGIVGEAWSTSASIADYDKDGLLDLYINNYIDYKPSLRTYEKASGFSASLATEFDSTLYDSQSNELYKNNGNLTFSKVTPSDVENPSGRSFSSRWIDINKDGYADLLVANDLGSPNKLFINQQGKSFTDASEKYNIATVQKTVAISVDNINTHNSPELIFTSSNSSPLLLFSNGAEGISNDFSYRDIARELGLDKPQLIGNSSWGMGLVDLNNDGWLDLFTANGFVTADTDAPKQSQAQPNTLLLNNWGNGFLPCDIKCFGENYQNESSRSAVFADFDNDGDLDSYITQNNALGQLLINQMKETQWVGINLVGTNNNSDAYGTKITVETAKHTYTRQFGTHTNFLSSGDKRILVGLGNENKIARITVQWPNGQIDTIESPETNKYLVFRQGQKDYTLQEITSPKVPKRQSAIAFKDPRFRLEIIAWLLDAKQWDKAENELYLLLENTDPLISRDAMLLASSLPTGAALKFLTQGVKAPHEAVREAAINSLKTLEQEISFRWIVQGLSDPSPLVRCATANAFKFFYQEEEAMIISKNLAIPQLIRLLDDREKEVKLCTIGALGSSENYRALHPLLLQTNHKDIEIRQQSIRALGLLREAEAIKPLEHIFLDPFQLGSVRAEALVALKKLGVKNINSLLEQAIRTALSKNNAQSLDNILQTFIALISNQESNVVINPVHLKKLVEQWNEKIQNHPGISQNTIQMAGSILDGIQPKNASAERSPVNFQEEIPTPDTKRLLAMPLKEKLKHRQSLLELLKDIKTPTHTRESIMADQGLSKLQSFRTATHTIANHSQDPLSPVALNHFIKTASSNKLEQLRRELSTPEFPEPRRFAIAKALMKYEPDFVLTTIISVNSK